MLSLSIYFIRNENIKSYRFKLKAEYNLHEKFCTHLKNLFSFIQQLNFAIVRLNKMLIALSSQVILYISFNTLLYVLRNSSFIVLFSGEKYKRIAKTKWAMR